MTRVNNRVNSIFLSRITTQAILLGFTHVLMNTKGEFLESREKTLATSDETLKKKLEKENFNICWRHFK